jgi:cell division protein FtsB
MCVVQGSFDERPGFLPGNNSNETANHSNLASERLRKAIERNRAKQMGRAEKTQTTFARPKSTTVHTTAPPPPRAESVTVSENLPTRRTVATANTEVEFVRPSRAPVRRPAEIGYTFTPSKKLNKKQSIIMSRIGWGFCAFLLLRLIFSDRGVIDFYDLKEIATDKVNEKHTIIKENEALIKDIRLIQDDAGYQRRLVRDHLGYVANDEYVVLFPSEKI